MPPSILNELILFFVNTIYCYCSETSYMIEIINICKCKKQCFCYRYCSYGNGNVVNKVYENLVEYNFTLDIMFKIFGYRY